MKTVQENIERLQKVMAEVKDHPMCAKLEDSGSRYTIFYPAGMYPNGSTAAYNEMGKAKALSRLLEVMERHWKENGI